MVTTQELKTATAEERKDLAAAAVAAAPTSEERIDVVRAVVEAAEDPKEVVTAAVEAASTSEEQSEVVKAVAEAAEDPKEVATAAVEAASTGEKKAVAAAAVDALSQTQRRELIESMWPSVSADRRALYMTGFIVAGAVALGLAAIAWAAQGEEGSISASLIVLATGFASAMLGGLLGAYIQR